MRCSFSLCRFENIQKEEKKRENNSTSPFFHLFVSPFCVISSVAPLCESPLNPLCVCVLSVSIVVVRCSTPLLPPPLPLLDRREECELPMLHCTPFVAMFSSHSSLRLISHMRSFDQSDLCSTTTDTSPLSERWPPLASRSMCAKDNFSCGKRKVRQHTLTHTH